MALFILSLKGVSIIATVQSSIKLFDAMTAPLKSITNGMNLMVSSMMKMQDTANRNVNIDKTLMAAKQQIASAEVEINRQINSAKQSQDNFKNSVNNTNSSMQKLAISVISLNQGIELLKRGFNAINSAMTWADKLASTSARLGLINDGLRTTAQLQKQVFDIADRTRASYLDTANLIIKIGAGTQGVFKTDDDVLKFAENFNKTLAISGATAVETSNAILQMSQALGSGVLQGDELRSLSETAPIMMRILSDGLGVARGQLKQMGADGELTADKIVKAFEKQTKNIDSMFAGLPVTFGGAMTVLQNQVMRWYSSLSQIGGPLSSITEKIVQLTAYLQTDAGQAFFNGLSNGIATAISWLISMIEALVQVYSYISDNWSYIEPIIWGLVTAFAAWKLATIGVAAAQGVNAIATYILTAANIGLTASWQALNTAMKANVIILIISAVVALIMYLVRLWKTNDQFAAGLMRAWNAILNFFSRIPIFFTWVGYGIANAFDWARVQSLKIMEDLVNGAIDMINSLIGVLNKIPGVEIEAVNKVSFAGEESIRAEARKQAREADLASMNKAADAKAAEREASVQKMLNDRASKRAQEDAMKGQKISGGGLGKQNSLFDPNKPLQVGDVGKVGKVGKIEDKVDISSEDLKLMRELAEMKTIQNFVSLAPTVQVTTGDVREEADINKIVAGIKTVLQEEIASSAAGTFNA